MHFILASSNLHKKEEFEKLLYPHSVDIVKDFSAEENGSTFKDNAIIKLKALEGMLNLYDLPEDAVLFADDSGLSIDIHPEILGLYTSRFEEGLPQAEKNKKVLEIMQNEKKRHSHFTCSLAFYPLSKKEIFIREGYLFGNIAKTVEGSEGFGYDPIFIPEGETKTLALLGTEYKFKNSHRARATREMLKMLNVIS